MDRRIALIVGNTNYADVSLAQLTSPQADATKLAAILEDPTIGGFEEVTVKLDASLTEVMRSIAKALNARNPGDTVLIYFSGHGVLDSYGKLYLAVDDTERNLLSATAISSSFIAEEMDRSNSKRQVLILDCCYSGAFARSAKGAFPIAVNRQAFEGNGFGRYVLTATDTTEYAWEGDRILGGSVHSVFTHYLIEGLVSGDADTDRDGLITLEELYQYIYERVAGGEGRQTPGKWTYKAQGDVLIARNPKSTAFAAMSLGIPSELQQAIVSRYAGVRRAAVLELAKATDAPEGLSAEDAILALRFLLNDPEPSVVDAVEAALRGEPVRSMAAVEALGRLRVLPSENRKCLALAPGVELSLVRVPGGKFLMGSREGEKDSHAIEFPQHAVHVPEFWIGQTAVTVKQFKIFVRETGYMTTAERRGGGLAWKNFEWQIVEKANWRAPFGPGKKGKSTDDHPVVFISWHDAIAFCKWAAAVTGVLVDLPTEAEWEKAGRGVDGRIWPWGSERPGTSLCNFALNVKQPTPVRAYSPDGDSIYGCADMAGNVWEWTNSALRSYPYRDEYDGSVLGEEDARVLKGGSFRSFAKRVRCAYRWSVPVDACVDGYGFRVVVPGSVDN